MPCATTVASEAGDIFAQQGEYLSFSDNVRVAVAPHSFPFPREEFGDVIDAVWSGRADFAVLPLFNSAAGRTAASRSLRKSYDGVSVVERIDYELTQSLLGFRHADEPIADAKARISKLLTHSVARDQCSRNIRDHIPQALIQIENDTAGAAYKAANEIAKGRLDIAAIASREVAEVTGLSVLEPEMNDFTPNITSFYICARALDYAHEKIFPFPSSTLLVADMPAGNLWRAVGQYYSVFDDNDVYVQHDHLDVNPFASDTRNGRPRTLTEISGSLDDVNVICAANELMELGFDLHFISSFPVTYLGME